ncbi:MAG: hypothetical protein MUC49_19150 [Raineya sp.]|jgi:hypothetical protein|nr:hypothetical protein [Raineya sp.]
MPIIQKEKRESIMLRSSIHRRIETLLIKRREKGAKTDKQTIVEEFVLKCLEKEEAEVNKKFTFAD